MNSRFKLLAVVLALCSAIEGWAVTPWGEQAQELANRIASLTGPGTASIVINNSSSIPNDQVPAIRKAIETQLKSSGVGLRESDVASEVTVTLSESSRAFVWIAEVKQGSETRVAMLEVPRTNGRAAATSVASLSLRKSLILSQQAQMLDVLLLPGQRLVVLEPDAIALYDQVEGNWHLSQSFPIVRATPFPRDLRGHLVPASDHLFDAFLPGIVCASDAKASAVDCHASDDPWPLGSQSAFFNSARNFFTGLTRPGFAKPIPAFYSAAALAKDKYTLWVFAGVDNQARTWDGVNLRNMGMQTRDWGSDLAAVRSGCGVGMQLLVSSAGDSNTSDSIRAFEIADREPTIVATPLSFDGPITSLWTAADQASAVAVVRNYSRGTYDAYSVSASCSQ